MKFVVNIRTAKGRAVKNIFKYIVLGLGGLGSAAAYWLARREGREVLGLEQFELGHHRGESQDHSRIIRLTYHTIPYVRLAQQAYKAWDTVEQESGERIVVKTGELNFWPPVTTLVEQDFKDAMTACGVPFEMLESAEISRRYPQFRFGDEIHAMYQADGGLAAAAKGNAAHQQLARIHGATLINNMPILGVRRAGNEYAVETPENSYRCEKIVIAAGPWTNRMLGHFDLELPLRVTKEQVSYFSGPNLREFIPGRFPVWIWMIEDNYYGFPVYGAPGVKVAKDTFTPTDPDRRTFDPDPANEEDLRQFMQKHIPRAVGPLLYTKTCILTHTPDVDFVIDNLPGHPNCLVAVGAAHAYKFASVIGRMLAELSIDGRTENDIHDFRFDRPALKVKRSAPGE
jgi:sarcosine oxidase